MNRRLQPKICAVSCHDPKDLELGFRLLCGQSNLQGRQTNGSAQPCSESASRSKERFVHVTQEIHLTFDLWYLEPMVASILEAGEGRFALDGGSAGNYSRTRGLSSSRWARLSARPSTGASACTRHAAASCSRSCIATTAATSPRHRGDEGDRPAVPRSMGNPGTRFYRDLAGKRASEALVVGMGSPSRNSIDHRKAVEIAGSVLSRQPVPARGARRG